MTDGRTQVGRAPRWPHDRDGDARPKITKQVRAISALGFSSVGNCVGRNQIISYYKGIMRILAEVAASFRPCQPLRDPVKVSNINTLVKR
jgi:hypothetical protein